jgi:hypothetical protein
MCLDESGRLWDVVWLLPWAIRGSNDGKPSRKESSGRWGNRRSKTGRWPATTTGTSYCLWGCPGEVRSNGPAVSTGNQREPAVPPSPTSDLLNPLQGATARKPLVDNEVTAAIPSACTPACTGATRLAPEQLSVEELVSAILGLSQGDRTRLAALLLSLPQQQR